MWHYLYVMLRWVRLTTQRYGASGLVIRYRSKHAGVGRAIRDRRPGEHGKTTGFNLRAPRLVYMLQMERGEFA